jgi:DNA-binding MarR family transcriptional regulator
VSQPPIPLREYQIAADLRAGLRKFLRLSEQASRRHGLTHRWHLLLLMIKGAPDGSGRSTVSDLTERIQLAQSTVTELVARAEEAGLIAREVSTEDKRVVWLSLTPEAERRLAGVVTDLKAEREALARMIATLEMA